MNERLLSPVRESRRRPLAACIASIFALSAPPTALAVTVTSCLDDGGSGTLRKVIQNAAEGATVDFAGLSCMNSTITLVGFAIPIAQNSLTIDGSGAASPLTVDASGLTNFYGDYRVFSHYGTGNLTVDNLTLSGGHVTHATHPVFGGCLASGGNVTLNSVTVTNCYAMDVAGSYTPTGGAISVSGNLTLNSSTVSYSSATGPSSALGGGVQVGGDLTLSNSSINHNYATASSGIAKGGGAYVHGNVSTTTAAYFGSNSASSQAGNAWGGGVFAQGNVTLNDAIGAKYYNLFAGNSATTVNGHAKGGSIYTYGSLTGGTHSAIVYSSASSTNGNAFGGGLYAHGALSLSSATVGHNTAKGSFSLAGGAFAVGNATISYTTVKYNRAYATGLAGGLLLRGANNTISSSTISNNTADYNIGGVEVYGGGSGATFELKNSTISGNSAGVRIGGMYVDSANVELWNSTIAFNTAGSTNSGVDSPGLELSTHSNAMAANLQSTLISNNSVGTYQLDLTVYPPMGSVTFNGGALLIPANNLVRATLVNNLPSDTKQDVCPHLGVLRNNGGLTYTHALLSHSVAIDAGNDSSLLALYDQRGSAAVNGTMDYTRFSGTGALADIGAYKVQQNDIVFNTDFEGCLPLSF